MRDVAEHLVTGCVAYINNVTDLTPLDKARFGETEELSYEHYK